MVSIPVDWEWEHEDAFARAGGAKSGAQSKRDQKLLGASFVLRLLLVSENPHTEHAVDAVQYIPETKSEKAKLNFLCPGTCSVHPY